MQHIKLPFILSNHRCKGHVILLAFLWISGLLCGMFFISAAGDLFSSLMYAAAFCRVSIVGLAAVLLFPLIVSAVAVYMAVPAFVLPICFLKAFCYGCVLFVSSAAFGNAGWLMRILLLFSDSCMMVPLHWFWCRHLSGRRDSLKRDLTVCVVLAAFIGSVDYFLVSPYLVELMNYL